MVKKTLLILFSSLTIYLSANNDKVELLRKKITNESSTLKKATYQLELAEIYVTASSYSEATEVLVNLIQVAEKNHYDTLLHKSCIQLGVVFFYQKNFKKSKYYYEKALDIDRSNPLYQASYFKRNGDIFIMEQKFDSSKLYYEKALEIFEKINYKDSMELAKLYSNYSILFDTDYIQRLEYALKADKYYNKRNENNLINKGNIGNTYKDIVVYNLYDSLCQQTTLIPGTKEDNLALAYKYVNDAIAIAKQNNDIDNGAYFTGILAEVQEADNDFKNAYYNFKIYYETMDSVYSQETKNDIANLESQIELNKKNAQIASQNKLRIVLIIGLIMLSIIGIIFYIQAKNRKLHNAKLSKLNEELNTANEIKAKLFGIISHDLRSPIANVVTLLQLKQDDGFNNEEDEHSFTNHVLKDAENLLENMETLLLWSKGQLKNFSPNNKQIAVSILFEHIVRFFRHERSVNIIFKNDHHSTIVSDELFLQVIMQNLTSNAIKALKSTSNPKITWEVIENENNISLKITDNGPGMQMQDLQGILTTKNTQSQKNGLGLQIVQDLVTVINGRLTFQTDIGKGFSVDIILPKK